MIRDALSVCLLFGLLYGGLWITPGLKPCPTEDARNCYWDAQTQGNGTGQDFVDLFGIAFHL